MSTDTFFSLEQCIRKIEIEFQELGVNVLEQKNSKK